MHQYLLTRVRIMYNENFSIPPDIEVKSAAFWMFLHLFAFFCSFLFCCVFLLFMQSKRKARHEESNCTRVFNLCCDFYNSRQFVLSFTAISVRSNLHSSRICTNRYVSLDVHWRPISAQRCNRDRVSRSLSAYYLCLGWLGFAGGDDCKWSLN